MTNRQCLWHWLTMTEAQKVIMNECNNLFVFHALDDESEQEAQHVSTNQRLCTRVNVFCFHDRLDDNSTSTEIRLTMTPRKLLYTQYPILLGPAMPIPYILIPIHSEALYSFSKYIRVSLPSSTTATPLAWRCLNSTGIGYDISPNTGKYWAISTTPTPISF